jgi:putative restriction endonuclease
MFAISPTDIDWFYFLREVGYNSEINFWTPTPWNISKLSEGDKLYFMLKSPIRKIGGNGQFLKYINMTVDDAWNKFGRKNGCNSKQELIRRLDKYKSKRSSCEKGILDAQIGCLILNNVEFFDDNDFLDLKEHNVEFPINIVKIKYYEGNSLNNDAESFWDNFTLISETAEKTKKNVKISERNGQGNFRAKITYAYSNRCCISGETTVELLEAAHIQPYIDERSNHVKNGLLLRADLHKLYDNGLMYIDDDFLIHISPQVKSNHYQNYNNKKIELPKNKKFHPSKESLRLRKVEFRNE